MIVGIDIGTQSLKVIVTDESFALRGHASRGYEVARLPTSAGGADRVEQDPGLWEIALAEALAEALGRAGASAEGIDAIGIAGQLDGCVPVDADGLALGPCLVWMDRRAIDEAARFDGATTLACGGVIADPSHMGAKIAWLERHRPGAARYHQPVSYLVERLTGVAVIDHSQASTTMLYELARRDWSDDALRAAGVRRDELPVVAEAASIAGQVTAAASEWSGLPRGVPVVVGTGDDFATALGAGIAGPGVALVGLGTAEVVGAVSEPLVIDRDALVQTHPYPTGGWFIENPGWMSGGAVAWLGHVLGETDPRRLDARAAQIPVGANGLTFLPALSGAMAPRWVPSARGCFYGLTAAHDSGHLVRAVLEGCAFAMRDVLERLRALGVPLERLRLGGGGARSLLWAQVRADLSGLPVEVASESDTSPMGAAMLAAVGAGVIETVAEAARRGARVRETLMPCATRRGAYDEAYGRYRRLFAALDPMF